MEYIFKEGEENKPANERIIEKRGNVVAFTLIEMENDSKTYEKTLKELRANRELKEGIMNNVAQNHPFIKEMSEFDRVVVHMYQEAFAYRKQYDDKINEIEAGEAEHLAEIEAIKQALPDLQAVVSPMAVEEGKVVDETIPNDTTE